MQWNLHYTGIEIANPTNDGKGWYLQRETNTKRLKYVRYHRGRYFGFTLHKGHLNYFREFGGYGFELGFFLPGNFHIGLSMPHSWFWGRKDDFRTRHFFQKRRTQHGFFGFRIGYLCAGFNLPKWLNRKIEAAEIKRWEQEMAGYEASYEGYEGSDEGPY